ncbi:glycoside hydrolase family 3 N-terminal domain-containing protein [Thalassotalea aquiviva]|uniref:glycoside hydrolase family 3 N-terminal domain-containing protein n=1 Tax=Thalassotalea aquiviva TaxID=3242415 RepID=UPI00352A4910
MTQQQECNFSTTINPDDATIDRLVAQLLEQMSLDEKIGQMCQSQGGEGHISEHLRMGIQQGQVGSVLNETNVDVVNELQRIAVEESRLGIPLLIGRDVIHGFKTIFPLPIAQAASFDPELVKLGARISAHEAASCGVNWTFSPMIDISRDPRWGRIAESFGEDPLLNAKLGVAMVQGYQSDNLAQFDAIAACAKHFVGYGASESGRDYNTANIPENELRNVYLPPFKAAHEAGVATMMASFSDLNGVPASGNQWLMQQVLREEWQYQGMVVSDWDSIFQLTVHGFADSAYAAANAAANAGIDMEMVSTTYHENIAQLLSDNQLTMTQVDAMVGNILRLKFKLNLFNQPYTEPKKFKALVNQQHLDAARDMVRKSCVLLKNAQQTLPLKPDELNDIAVIGPLADDGYEQLGTWIFDGDEKHSVTPLAALKHELPEHTKVHVARALSTSRSNSEEGFADAVKAAQQSDIALLFLGEESILSGEAHCRTNIDLPGAQEALINQIAATGTPIVLVTMAGRPLTLSNIIDKVGAILYAWHPGSMAGPGISDLLLGKCSPSGKLPVSFVRHVGQVPLYYAQKHTGKPASDSNFVHMDDFPVRAPQTSMGMSATHLDCHFTPLFPFGFGLTYSNIHCRKLQLNTHTPAMDETIYVSVEVMNEGDVDTDDVIQLYIRDLVANVTRPVKELKAFKRVHLPKHSSIEVKFALTKDDLSFYNQRMQQVTEPGKFHLWVGNSSDCQLQTEFELRA